MSGIAIKPIDAPITIPFGFFNSFKKSAILSFVPIPNMISCSMGITSTPVLKPQSVKRNG